METTEQIAGIYKITNKVNGKVYIGKSKDIKARWKKHIQRSKTSYLHLYSAMRKYGLENFSFEVLFETARNDRLMDFWEVAMIAEYQAMNKNFGYNNTRGGDGCSPSEATRQKMSNSQKGKKHSEETKRKLSEIARNPSKETREKMAIAKRGCKLSIDHKQRIALAARNISDETREKMSRASTGRKHSEETKEKMSQARKGWVPSEETRRKMSFNARNMSIETKEKIANAARNISDETREKMSQAKRGKTWWTNGVSSVLCFECPCGFWKGRVIKPLLDNQSAS